MYIYDGVPFPVTIAILVPSLFSVLMHIFWFRRDLRLEDNHGLYQALRGSEPVLCVFIWDPAVLGTLEPSNPRVSFMHDALVHLEQELQQHGSSLCVLHQDVLSAWQHLATEYPISCISWNEDYDPRACARDQEVRDWAAASHIRTQSYKDQVLFAKDEVLSGSHSPYTVFTPYSKRWKALLQEQGIPHYPSEKHLQQLAPVEPFVHPTLEELGFEASQYTFPPRRISLSVLKSYGQTRDIPSLLHGTSRLGVHLRFGTLSIRRLIALAVEHNETYLNELIWREFYQMILWHFPQVITQSFRPEYDQIPWRNNQEEFATWCSGRTGYPMVDAGMRQLVSTGYMHNRVRMIVASFLTKHLLIDWRWGEEFFGKYLLDYELAANNGGWQWAAGCGCDAAPYFRVFNPTLQQQRFDPEEVYIRQWIPEYGTADYPTPMVEHKSARLRALETYKAGLGKL